MKPGTMLIESKRAITECMKMGIIPRLWLMNKTCYETYSKSSLFVLGGQIPTLHKIEVKKIDTEELFCCDMGFAEMMLITSGKGR